MALALLCHYRLQVAFRICLGFYLGVVLPDIGDYLSRKFNEMDLLKITGGILILVCAQLQEPNPTEPNKCVFSIF